jgi:hypothetical protein
MRFLVVRTMPNSNNTRPLLAPLIVTAVLLTALPAARGDIFRLEQGGQIEGQWLNQGEQPLVAYRVRTSAGITVTLPLAEVKEAVRQSGAEQEYVKRAPQSADTVDGQWDLAEWCRKNGLARERAIHLRRIIELAPNHKDARYALGYQFLNGEWITRDDAYRNAGYEFYRGKWRTPQEIEILEARGRTDVAEKDWLLKIRRWRHDLDTDKAKLAYDLLVAIKDPVAVRPLADCFGRERASRVKMLYADILAQIHTSEAVGVLADRALADADEEIFYYCVGKLTELKPPHVSDIFIAALKDKSNARVNRGATALARLRDKTAISPLVDALITTHTQVVAGAPGTSADSTTATFGSDGSFMKKGEGPTALVMHVHNQPVLDALTKLSGEDFGFDQRAWRYWHAQEKIAQEAKQAVGNLRGN